MNPLTLMGKTNRGYTNMISRKGKQVDVLAFAKRILVDSNVRCVSFFMHNAGRVKGTTITKSHGKYYINNWCNQEEEDQNIWCASNIRCISRDDIAEKLIKELHGKCDKYTLLDKHLNPVHWEITYGELPEGFELVKEELEAIPEEIEV